MASVAERGAAYTEPMCGRFTLTVENQDEVAAALGLTVDQLAGDGYYLPHYNAAPMQELWIARLEGEERMMRHATLRGGQFTVREPRPAARTKPRRRRVIAFRRAPPQHGDGGLRRFARRVLVRVTPVEQRAQLRFSFHRAALVRRAFTLRIPRSAFRSCGESRVVGCVKFPVEQGVFARRRVVPFGVARHAREPRAQPVERAAGLEQGSVRERLRRAAPAREGVLARIGPDEQQRVARARERDVKQA